MKKAYRVRLYTAGSTDTSTANVQYTLTGALNQAVTVRYPNIRPLTGRVETQPYEVSVLDEGSSFTGWLADTSGRTDMINRLVTVAESVDGGAYSQLGVGRVAYVRMGQNVASYQVGISDENRIARTATIFASSNTTRLFPPGRNQTYGPFPVTEKAEGSVVTRYNTNQCLVRLDNAHKRITDLGVDAVKSDLNASYEIDHTSTVGNFKHVRLRVGSSDFPVHTFNVPIKADILGVSNSRGAIFDSLDRHREDGSELQLVVVSTSLSGDFSSAFLHMFTAPASPATPLHIGSAIGTNPVTLIGSIFDGDYSSSGAVLPRYDSAALTAISGHTPRPYMRFRITEPQPMQTWLEDHIYGPLGIAPMIDSSGAIAPISLWLPNTTAVDFTFTGTNLREPHPTWVNSDDNHVTSLRFEYTHETQVRKFDPTGKTKKEVIEYYGQVRPTEGASDLITVTDEHVVEQHDRIGLFGEKVHTYNLRGHHSDNMSPYEDQRFDLQRRMDDAVHLIKRETFDRFGDGPILGTFHALTTASTVAPGAKVSLDLESYPAVSTATIRGGARTLQILGKTITPAGPSFNYIDAGLGQAGTPTVTLSSSPIDPKHSIRATIASVPVNGGFQAQVIKSSDSPSTSSANWVSVYMSGETSGVYPITQLPAGSYWWARVRGVKGASQRSPWNMSSTNQQTSGLAGPTNIDAAGAGNTKSQLITWTVGETDYPLHIHVDTDTGATLGLDQDNIARRLPAGTDRYTLRGLDDTDGAHLVGVRHYGPYGGFSTFASTTFTPSGAPSVAPDMLGIRVLRGGAA